SDRVGMRPTARAPLQGTDRLPAQPCPLRQVFLRQAGLSAILPQQVSKGGRHPSVHGPDLRSWAVDVSRVRSLPLLRRHDSTLGAHAAAWHARLLARIVRTIVRIVRGVEGEEGRMMETDDGCRPPRARRMRMLWCSPATRQTIGGSVGVLPGEGGKTMKGRLIIAGMLLVVALGVSPLPAAAQAATVLTGGG